MPAVDVVCHYHEPDKAPFLLAAVLPLARQEATGGLRAHVERHWLHGPHLRIRLDGPDGEVTGAARRCAAALEAAVREHPSRVSADPARLLAQAAVTGRAELVPPPYEPIHPDNTVRVEPADDGRLERLLGSAAAVAHRNELMRLGLDAVDASARWVVDGGCSPTARVWAALTAMAAHAAAYPYGLAGGYQSFLSHVEDFLFQHDPHGTVRGRFDAAWQRRADEVTACVDRVAGGEHDGDPLAAAWAGWAAAAWRVCGPAADRGELPARLGDGYASAARQFDAGTARRWDTAEPAPQSAYHAMLAKFDLLRGAGPAFVPYRFATNVLYQLLLVCDVRPLDRYLAAYLLARAAERSTGRSWRDDLAALAAATDAAAGPAAAEVRP